MKQEPTIIPTPTSTSLSSSEQILLPHLFSPLPSTDSSPSLDVVVEGDMLVVCSGGEEVAVPSLLLSSVLPWLAPLLEEEGSFSSLLSIPSISSSTITTLLTSFYSNTPSEEGLEAMQAIQALGAQTPEIVKREKVEKMPVVMEDGPSDNVESNHEESEEGEIENKKAKFGRPKLEIKNKKLEH